MRALVTGGNGFLGANLIKELSSFGWQVRAMVRNTADLRSLKGLEYEMFHGEITNNEHIKKAAEGCSIIIHTAANTSQNALLSEYYDVNVNGTKNVIDAVKYNRIGRLIFVSTANTFGNGTKEIPGNEEIPINPVFARSGYAKSKLIAQQLVLEAVKKEKINATVVNPSFMIGPNDAKPSSGRIILHYYKKRLLLLPPGGKSFIHVKDVVRGICNAIDKGKSGECYLLTNENLTYAEFFDKLSEITGISQTKIMLPAAILRTTGVFGNLAVKLGIRTEINMVNAQMLCEENYFSAAKAISDLKLPQTPVKDAIKDAVEWFSDNGYLVKK